MRYAQIRKMDISNGEGVGIALFVQGCPFHCIDCFNQETWDFNGGKEWTTEVENQFIELAKRPYITRITLLGGEPLHNKNVRALYLLLKKIKKQLPHLKIWIYTGFKYENIFIKNFDELLRSTQADEYRQSIIKEFCDVLVDGQFETDKKDLTLKFKGSRNQRVIDVQETLKHNKIILYCD